MPRWSTIIDDSREIPLLVQSTGLAKNALARAIDGPSRRLIETVPAKQSAIADRDLRLAWNVRGFRSVFNSITIEIPRRTSPPGHAEEMIGGGATPRHRQRFSRRIFACDIRELVV
jgi:hypothetical protein